MGIKSSHGPCSKHRFQILAPRVRARDDHSPLPYNVQKVMYQAVPSSILALPAAHQNASDALPTPSGSFPDSSQLTPGSYSHYPAHGQGYTTAGQSNQNPVLPPFSSLQTMGLPFLQQANVLLIRFDNGHSQPTPRQRSQPGSSGKKRAPGSTDEDTGQLPDSVLVAPLEVLRDLVDVASERSAKENGDSSGPQNGSQTPSPSRTNKRRKIPHEGTPRLIFPDGVTKKILGEIEQVPGHMRIVSGSMYEGTPGTGPSMVNLAEEEMDEEESEWAVRASRKRRASAEADYGDAAQRKRPRLNESTTSWSHIRRRVSAGMYTPDQTIRQIAADFEFTVDEVQAYYNRCGEMGRTRTRFQNMRELLTIKFPDDE
ncbi:hypothetical protein B0H14DRAFT_2889221 [Mycena olivaceomarginata]|nr:hypothetical protein B0H14DRAFT_2889221 [Mycena olivaceomarginata]